MLFIPDDEILNEYDTVYDAVLDDCGDSERAHINAITAVCRSAIEQASRPQEGWIWMRHPSRNNGDWLPAYVFEEDGVKYYQPFDAFVLTEFEWDKRDPEWEVREQASQPQWIPVSERMPQEGEPVLIWMRPETVHDSIHNVIVSNPVFARKQAELGFVTHWMPLPAAPENAV